MLEVRLLGQFDVRRDGAPILVPARAAQSLFAYLLLGAGTTFRREKLAGQLWSDLPDEHARRNLRHELWRLRQAIETKTRRKNVTPYFVADDISIGIDPRAEYWLDVSIVQSPLSNPVTTDSLIETLSLYRGELLPGFYDEWVVLERERVRAVFEQKMERLLELLVEAKRWQEILDWGERWIALGQTPEPAYRALMMAHRARGNVSQVASVYERCVQAMRNELGVEPSEQTRALFARLSKEGGTPQVPVRAASSLAAQTSAVLETRHKPEPLTLYTSPRSSNLPAPLTSFIGREREVVQMKELLSTTRLVTLTGSGGIGKTRLAIQLATDLSSHFKDGVWWVELAALSDPTLVPQAVAKSLGLGVREVSNVPLIETLTEVLRSMQVLLVLDNCEHLVAACAQLVEILLRSCSSLKILATSREALRISGETIWRVPSLSIPENVHQITSESLKRYESVRLFEERARAVKSDFTAGAQNASPIVQICQRLDGIPLAIELAAARVGTLSVQQIAARLNDRFMLLNQGSRTALPRHQTLRATIDWSYDLLSEPEKVLLHRLSVFAGGCTLEAAEAVGAGDNLAQKDVLEFLSRLVDKSLVIVEEEDGTARYRMLETIRQYAKEKLAETREIDIVYRRHLEFFAKLAEESGAKLFGGEQSLFLDRLELEIDNLRAALDWAQENHQTAALQIVGAIPRFWFVRAHLNEGLDRMRAILAHPDAMHPSAARLQALNAYFSMLWPSGHLTEFQPLIDEALALGKRFGDSWNTAFALLWQGFSSTVQGDYMAARSYLEQSLHMYQELGDTNYSAWAVFFLGEVEWFQGKTARAQALYKQAIAKFEESKDYIFLAVPLRRLGQLAMAQGDFVKASAFIEQSLEKNWSLRDYPGVGACFAALGALSMAQKQMERAAKFFGMLDMRELIRTPILLYDAQQYRSNVDILRTQLDEASFAAAWAEGKAMSMEQAVEYAMEVTPSTL